VKKSESDALRRALDAYPAVVERQGVASLPGLDKWCRLELPKLIAKRKPAHITLEELTRLTEWKMARGVWRARNLALVRGNDPKAVEEVSALAFSKVPHPTLPIAQLTKLAGVGPATASAALAAFAPEVYPFFDDLVAGQLGLGPVAWTSSYYAKYADALRRIAEDLGTDWTPVRLERAIWSYAGGKAGLASSRRLSRSTASPHPRG
jgi:hypothetical protein